MYFTSRHYWDALSLSAPRRRGLELRLHCTQRTDALHPTGIWLLGAACYWGTTLIPAPHPLSVLWSQAGFKCHHSMSHSHSIGWAPAVMEVECQHTHTHTRTHAWTHACTHGIDSPFLLNKQQKDSRTFCMWMWTCISILMFLFIFACLVFICASCFCQC